MLLGRLELDFPLLRYATGVVLHPSDLRVAQYFASVESSSLNNPRSYPCFGF